MPVFRARSQVVTRPDGGSPTDLQDVRALISDALRPAHFYLRRTGVLEWQPPCAEEVSWETYHGRLLDPAHTRERRQFEAWNIFWVDAEGRSAEPILSVKWDEDEGHLHVVRSIHCYAWEGYHAGDNVYLSRETRKWLRELVGTIKLRDFTALQAVGDELICLLFQAVVGASRLPLTSVEAPLPAFSLGELAYVYRPAAGSELMQSFRDLIQEGLHEELNWLERTKLLEAVLRGINQEEVKEAAELFIGRWRALGHDDKEFAALCRSLFNEVALSPYTEFVDRALSFVNLAMRGPDRDQDYVDFLSYLLRQTARHLTAYDLITFHHRGANYPDALLLDSVLQRYLAHLERQADLFCNSPADDPARQRRKRIRRRALRQAWLLRQIYEGLPVPDAPTSPGENNRILPAPHQRVPEEQILQPAMRTKQLYAVPTNRLLQDDASLLAQCGLDLQNAEELQELGMAIFLDRPLGVCKAPGEPDRTPLFSYEAWSRSIAEQRLEILLKDACFYPCTKNAAEYRQALRNLRVSGVPVRQPASSQRPGAVSLADAAKAANDFILLRTTRQTVQAFLGLFDFTALKERVDGAYLDSAKRLLIVNSAAVGEPGNGKLLIYDNSLSGRLEMQIDPSQGYQSRAGIEYPAAGLR
ncbi:MAG TPA: hypothetical protein VG099_16840, partial [Gemmataceae bacterium]|nr:hypothetical protein [Gemmataceae bacterium]